MSRSQSRRLSAQDPPGPWVVVHSPHREGGVVVGPFEHFADAFAWSMAPMFAPARDDAAIDAHRFDHVRLQQESDEPVPPSSILG